MQGKIIDTTDGDYNETILSESQFDSCKRIITHQKTIKWLRLQQWTYDIMIYIIITNFIKFEHTLCFDDTCNLIRNKMIESACKYSKNCNKIEIKIIQDEIDYILRCMTIRYRCFSMFCPDETMDEFASFEIWYNKYTTHNNQTSNINCNINKDNFDFYSQSTDLEYENMIIKLYHQHVC